MRQENMNLKEKGRWEWTYNRGGNVDPRSKATVIEINQTAARKAGRIPFISTAIAGTYRIPLLDPLSTTLAFSRLQSPTLHLLG